MHEQEANFLTKPLERRLFEKCYAKILGVPNETWPVKYEKVVDCKGLSKT